MVEILKLINMFDFLKKPIEPPRSGPLFIVLAILAVVLMISNFAKDSRYFGYYLLGFSILMTIMGIGMAFSKKERERTRQRVTAELPERAALINVPNADHIFQRRGYITLAIGLALFILWSYIYGFSSLAE